MGKKYWISMCLCALIGLGASACEFQSEILEHLESFDWHETGDTTDTNNPDVVDRCPPDPQTACPAIYDIVDIGAFSEDGSSNAFAVNDDGTVTGSADSGFASPSGAFLWQPSNNNNLDGKIFQLDDLGADSGLDLWTLRGNDLNNFEETVGMGMEPCYTGASCATPFYWTRETGVVPILPGQMASVSSINNDGIAVGRGRNEHNEFTAYLWSVDDGIEFLPLYSDDKAYSNSRAYDINDGGMVVGEIIDSNFTYHAFKWTRESGYTVLPDMGNTSLVAASASAVNNKGQVVGNIKTVIDETRPNYGTMVPVLWNKDGSYIDLGILSSPEGLTRGEATAINDHGHVIGFDSGARIGSMPWIWCGEKQGKRSLDDLIHPDQQKEWEISSVFDINDEGHIVGIALHNGFSRAFVLVPRPLSK